MELACLLNGSILETLDTFIPDFPLNLRADYMQLANENDFIINDLIIARKLYHYIIEKLETEKIFPIIVPLCLDQNNNIIYNLKSKKIEEHIYSVIVNKLVKANYSIRISRQDSPFIPNWQPHLIINKTKKS